MRIRDLVGAFDDLRNNLFSWNAFIFKNIYKHKSKVLAQLCEVQKAIHHRRNLFLYHLEHHLI